MERWNNHMACADGYRQGGGSGQGANGPSMEELLTSFQTDLDGGLDSGGLDLGAAPQPVKPQPVKPVSTTPVRQATQADTGWRSQQPTTTTTSVRQATQADTGWRSQQQPATTTPVRQATQADTGWRSQQQPATTTPVRQATQADTGWRSEMANMLDPQNLMTKATANAFVKIEDFQNAVGSLPWLTTSNGKQYRVTRTLSKAGGESAVVLCQGPDGKESVAKVYFEPVDGAGSSVSARTRVLEYMRTPEGQKYTLAVQEIGLVELQGSKYYFEIMPYCYEGDLSSAKAFTFDQIVSLTKYLNEALHSMHQAQILHRDLKPANLYRYEGRIVIGDFGVAKLVNAGATQHTVGTDGYRAPESVLAVTSESTFFFDEACDYYSLGVTLGSLYEGHFVYENMSAAMMTSAVMQGRLPLTKLDPKREKLENLLRGLCQYDANRRFTYEDVCKWLENHDYAGTVESDEWPNAFRFMGTECRDERSVFEAATKDKTHWDEAKEMLYDKYFEQFFRPFRTDLARAAQKADEAWRTRDRDRGLAVFLKSLYPLGPIVWKGYTFKSLKELGEKMAHTSTAGAYGEILQKQCISHWLKNTKNINVEPKTIALVESIEKKAEKEPELACYWFGNSFAERRALRFAGRQISTVKELIQLMFAVPQEFYVKDGQAMLMDRKFGAALYGFLYSFGYQKAIDAQWAQAERCDEFNKACILLSLLDQIAEKEKADTALLRNFFLFYGPMSIATYTKRLVDEAGAVYCSISAEGEKVLSKIRSFQLPAAGTVDSLFKALTPLLDLVKQLQGQLADNPFCIPAGAYGSEGVLCTDLSGCFACSLFGRAAPLGVQAWILADERGNVR